jgi:hypothetical protein
MHRSRLNLLQAYKYIVELTGQLLKVVTERKRKVKKVLPLNAEHIESLQFTELTREFN